MRQKSLLSKSLSQFLLCTGIVFLLATPLFYLLTKLFYAEDMIDIIEAVESGQGIPPLDLERDIMIGVMIQYVLIFLVLSVSLYVTMRFATRRLWKPFNATLHKAEQFNLAQGEVPDFGETGISEFARMNRSLTTLMTKSKEHYRIQKEFTENASHELQTPLAVVRTKLDLLMQENLNERQMRLVADLYELTTRMGHLNRNLLLLAKIENAQYSATEEVDVAALLAESLPLYGVLQNGISTSVTDLRTLPHTLLRANPVLLECLLKNLIVNAMRHSAKGSRVTITLNDSCLTVSNEATGNCPLDSEKLFQRFRSDNARQRGNGLGLAIVKAICDFHGWAVQYQFASGCHQFIVLYPASF